MLTRRRALANGLLAALSLVLGWPGRLTGFQAATAHPISLAKSMRRENCPFIRDLETEVMENVKIGKALEEVVKICPLCKERIVLTP